MVGLHILKHMFDLSDDGVCDRWVYDPYFQHFCGEAYFRFELPIDRSSMSRWRDRIGPDGLEKVFQEIGHLKCDGRLGRNYLKGRDGDKTNAILAGAGYNYRLVLKWLRLLFAWIMDAILGAFRLPAPAEITHPA